MAHCGDDPKAFSFDSERIESIMEKLNVSSPINRHVRLGLTMKEAEDRLKMYGENKIPPLPRKMLVELFMDQFDDRLVQILLFVAGLSSFSSISEMFSSPVDIFQSLVEPATILLILLINAAVGVWQQLSALDSMDALEKLQPRLARVLRSTRNPNHDLNGEWMSGFDAGLLVPGDIINLKTGDMIPADAKMIDIESSFFTVDESYLTGESEAVQKIYGNDRKIASRAISDQATMLFSGTLVTHGNAFALVVRTGNSTEIGKIHAGIMSVEENKTPLGIKLDDFGNDLAVIIAFICAAVWLVSVPKFSDPSFPTLFDGALYYAKVGVALSVAAIPEGLPAVVTLVLALGTRRLAERNVIVRKLPAVETLGTITVICTDKTGTITMNQMTAVSLLTLNNNCELVESTVHGISYDPLGTVNGVKDDEINKFPTGAIADILAVSFGCNDAELIKKDNDHIVVGEPTEGALLCLGEKLGPIKSMSPTCTINANRKIWQNSWEKCATLEFDRERKSMSVLCRPIISQPRQESSQTMLNNTKLLVKGAPDTLLSRCCSIKCRDGTVVSLIPTLRNELKCAISSMSCRPLRCLLLAVKEIEGRNKPLQFKTLIHNSISLAQIESNLTVVGIVGIKDPVRYDVSRSIDICKKAGIRVIMISGDAKETTAAIAKEINILRQDELNTKVFTGNDFFSKDKEEQRSLLANSNAVFYRTEPIDKQKIVKLLQTMDEIPAVAGDGVNDAPALKQASIGVAMGSGSDVAKEAADMILVDDSFSTIVNGVEEGRCIYANIQAFINFLISCNVGEVIAVFLASIMGFPSMFSAIQLLLVNLFTDGPPAVALGFNPKDVDVMKEKPRDINESVITTWLLTRYLVTGLYIGLATIGIFASYYQSLGLSLDHLSHWSTCSVWSAQNLDLCQELFEPEALAVPRTLALSTLVLTELLKALSTVSVDSSILKVPPFLNRYLVLGVSIPFSLHIAILYIPFLSKTFGLVRLSVEQWIAVVLWSLPVLLVDEVLKAIGHKLK